VIQPLYMVLLKRIYVMLLRPTVIIDQFKNRENVYLLLGFDMNANPVEIMYNEEDNGINVFHAMPCQKKFYHLF